MRIKGEREKPIILTGTHVAQKIRNVWRALIQAYGPTGLKRWIWNREFSEERRSLLHINTGHDVYSYIENYVKGESILDLGCGLGGVSDELDPKKYDKYMGVDISDIAIEQARQMSFHDGREAKIQFCQSDICSYVPTQQYTVILFRDSLYYVPRERVLKMLQRYRQYLTMDGVFIVRMMHGNRRYRGILELIERNFDIKGKHVFTQPEEIIIIFGRSTASLPS